MDVFLDEQPISVARPTLRAAFDAAIEHSQGQGRVIVEIHADGAPLAGELLSDPPDEAIDASELRFITAAPRAMVREVLFQAVDALEQAQRDQEAASESIQKGSLNDARRSLEQATELWQMVVLAVKKGGELIEEDLLAQRVSASQQAPEGPVGDRLGTLGSELTQMMQALEAQDWSQLSDMLEEEMAAQAELWRDTLRELAETVDPRG